MISTSYKKTIKIMRIKKKLSLVLFIAFFSIIGCDDTDVIIEHLPPNFVLFEVNEIPTQEIPFPILYNRLIENSLCPEDAVCIWQGRAIVELTIDLDTKVLLGLGNLINTNAVKKFEFNDYSIELVEVIDDGQKIILKICPL